jgi:ketosteroid isomerase-like protein
MFDAGFRVKCNVTRTLTAGDVAATYNDWTGTARGPDGTETDFSGKAIEICRRTPDGTWRFIIDDPYARG